MVRPANLKLAEFTPLQKRVANFVENVYFSRFIIVVIIINAVTLGLETDAGTMAVAGQFLSWIDNIALSIFIVEICLKLFIYRFSFFRQGWNVFDFLIIGIAIIPSIGPLSVLRALRILRVLRLVSVVPQMRRVISALLHSIPGMASIMAVLLIIFYVSAVLVTKLFGLPSSDPHLQEIFGSVGASMYTLFEVMTLENWSEGVVRPAMESYPYAWAFFIPFIIMTSFAVLNLFIGIIVDAMNFIHDHPEEVGVEPAPFMSDPVVHKELAHMRAELAEIKALLEK